VRPIRFPIDAAYALPSSFGVLLVLGAVAAALGGRLDGAGVLIVAAVVTALATALAQPPAALPVAAIAWLTVTGFSAPPYGQLQGSPHRGVVVGVTLVAAALTGLGLGTLARYRERHHPRRALRKAGLAGV
jgi:hypothetical protein